MKKKKQQTETQKEKQSQKIDNFQNEQDKNILKKVYHWFKSRKKKPKKKPQTFQEAVWSWTKTIVGAIIIVMIINGIAIASFVVPTGSMEDTVLPGDFLFVNKFIYGPSTPQVIPFLNIPLPFYKFPGIKEPEKGDVIVFIYPGDYYDVKPKEFVYYLKRCIATAGDTLTIINKKVFVNGIEYPLKKIAPKGKFLFPINNRPANSPYSKNFTLDNYGPVRIPKKGDTIRFDKSNLLDWSIFIQREGHKVDFYGDNLIIDGKKADYYIVERNYCFGMGDNRDNSEDSRSWGFIPYDNVVGSPLIIYWSWDPNIPLFDIFNKIGSIRWSRIASLIN